MFASALLPLVALAGVALASVQHPFAASFPRIITAGHGNSTAHLSSIISSSEFTTLGHAAFPRHSVRIKKTDFCDPTVNVFTGYLDIDDGAKHLFFYFFESRRDPDNDDVMMWINGGPGCSSSTGLLMELGPCSIDMKNASSNGTVWNPYSWNAEANIFFLDQPVGVGFSYAEYEEKIETTEDAAKNVHAFVSIFFETFSQFAGRRFHLSGESYGGRYLPVFAAEIYDQNAIARKEGRPEINMASVLIGNGNTDIYTNWPGRYEVGCGTASLDAPLLSISTCVRMKQALPRCQAGLRKSCLDAYDEMNCRAAVEFCDSELSAPMWATGKNVYDISKPCLGRLCYAENNAIEAFLDRPSTRATLGVTSPSNFSACSDAVARQFDARLDKFARPTPSYVAQLLERGVPVLVYAGTYDWQCNWVSNRMFVDALEWGGAEAWRAAEWRDWSVGGGAGAAGETKRHGPLMFATIRGAGHMVPHDRPLEALTMVSRWITGQEL